MAIRTPRNTLRSLAAIIAMLALMTLSLGSALAHNSTGGTGRDKAPAAGVLTANVRVLTDGGDVNEASEQEDVDEVNNDATDDTKVDNPAPKEKVKKVDKNAAKDLVKHVDNSTDETVDENDQGQDEQADENDDNQDEANDDSGGGSDENDDSGDEGGDD